MGCSQALALDGLCLTLRCLHILGLVSITYLPGPQLSHLKRGEKKKNNNPGGCLLLTPHEVDFQGPSQQVQSWVWGPGLCQLSSDPP